MECDGLPRFVDTLYGRKMPCTTQSLPIRGAYSGLETSVTPSPPQVLQIRGSPPIADQPNQPSYHMHKHQQDNLATPLEALGACRLHHQHQSPPQPPERSSTWDSSSWAGERNHPQAYTSHDTLPGLQLSSSAPTGSSYTQTWKSLQQQQQPLPQVSWRTTVSPQQSQYYRQGIAQNQALELTQQPSPSPLDSSSSCYSHSTMSPTWSISSAPDHFRGSFDFPSGAAAQISFPCQQPPGPQQQYPHHQYPGGGIAGGAPTNTMVSFPSSGPQPTTTGVSSDYDESPLMGLASATTTSPSGGRHPTGDDQNKNNNNNNNNTTVVGDSSSAGCTGRNAATTTGGKEEPEPYARLIHRAFMSCPGRPMTLQEIYQWFRENTDKDKSESKGWQNSIRHNLSMNAAFTKPERLSNGAPGPKDDNDEDGGGGGGGGEESSPRAGAGKKSTEWILEQWAARDGVQSTTRYRNSPRRGGAGKASSAGSRPKKKGPAKRGVAGTAAAAQAAEWEADVQQQQGRRRQRQAQKQALLQRQELQGQYIPVAPAMEHHQQQDQYQHQYHGLPMPLTLPMHIHNRHHNDHHHQQQLSTFLPSTYGGKTPDFPGYSPPPSSSAAATMSLFNTPPPPPPPPPSSSAGSVVPATVKSEAEEADEAMTPAESGFAFREPGVLLPELQQVGGGDVVAVYGGAGRVVDVSQYGLGSVAGVYEEGLFQGCVWDPEASYDQC